ncbi:unnamed protein product [Ceutorhynchus assimilis]|uniref:Regulatory protein zeste n=1 Tax=Ceutorhynchus assimilis TaxID=467358 RepID=A0A9N9MSH2_9CUCU|nr:unnamed protein product [Ceutorhynchus assimilis]
MAKALSSKQKQILVDFVYDRPEMYKGKFTSTYTHAVSMVLWKQVASILNAIPGGANKEWTQWRKTWVDLKKQVKNKKSKEKQHIYGTGGGPPLPPTLEDVDKTTDEKIFEIITPVAFEGNRDVPEPQIVFEEFLIPAPADKNTAAIDTNNVMDTEDATRNAVAINTNHETTPSRSTGTSKKVTKSGQIGASLRNNQNFLAISEKGIDSTEREQAANNEAKL